MADAHSDFAAKVLVKLPKATRDEAEVVEGSGAYSILKVGGRSVASIRGKNARITFAHKATAKDADDLAKLVAKAATTKAAAPKEEKAEDD